MLSKKYLDFCDWSIIVNICFYGYHNLSEGLDLIYDIKSGMNNFRLSTSIGSQKIKNRFSLNNKISYLFSLPAPYIYKDGLRYLNGTNKLVSENLKLIAIDQYDNKFYYSSLINCSKALKIGRKKIKECLISNKFYKGYKFIYDIN